MAAVADDPGVFLRDWLGYTVGWALVAGGSREELQRSLLDGYLDQYLDQLLKKYRSEQPTDLITLVGLSAMRTLFYAPILSGARRLVDGRRVTDCLDNPSALTEERRFLANMFVSNVAMARSSMYTNSNAVALVNSLKDILRRRIFHDAPGRDCLYDYYDRERSLITL